MKKYEYLLFDADNTLFDFDNSELNAFRDTCAEWNIPFTDELYRAYSQINDMLWKKLELGAISLERLKTERFALTLDKHLGITDNTAMAEGMRDAYISSLSHQCGMLDGAVDTVSSLAEEYKLYIVTNGIGSIQRSRLAHSAVAEYISDIFISEEIGCAKPASRYFEYVMEKIGDGDRRKYLVIGDSLTSDCDGAIAAGMDICRYNPMKKSSEGRVLTYTISRLTELKDMLLR